MTNEGSVLDSMREALEEEPDAAVLLTLNDIERLESGDYPEPSFSLFADAGGEEEEQFARRFLALACAKFLGKHFPNEAKAGVAKSAGGSVSFSGTFVDPETELRRRADGEPEAVTDGGENESVRLRDVSLGEPGAVTVEYSDADGDGFSEEFDLGPGSAMVIEGPDGFMMTYRVPGDGDD